MTQRKRRKPGGGRKPRGPFKAKTVPLGTRITVETRKMLEASAKELDHSLSQAAEFHIRRSLTRAHNRRDDIFALTEAIASVIEYVERTTKERWADSAFTTAAIRHAADSLIRHFGAKNTLAVPVAIKELATRLPTDYAARSHDPAEVGTVEAGRLITEIVARDMLEGIDPLELKPPDGAYVPPEWWRYRTILRKLGSG